MKTGIYLSYSGLGANLIHLAYCHQVAKKYGPVTIITLNKNLKDALADDPLIEKVFYLDKFNKKFFDIFKLSKILKNFNFDNLLIYYPSLRIYLAAKIAGIKHVFSYKFYRKKNLHLIKTAKLFTEKILNIENSPTETNFYIKKERLDNIKSEIQNDYFKIVLGVGSSGPTTRWGSKNFSNLVNNLNKTGKYFFLILCGPNEKEVENEITSNLENDNFITLSDKKIYDVLPYLCMSDMYVGNDSFGSHVISQSGKKSIVFLLDAPKAYTDYSKNHYRLVPDGYNIEEITHGTNADPNLISVEKVIETINNLKS